MTQSEGQLVFGYWALRGIGEPSRLVLHYTKTPFTDKMYQIGNAPDYSRDGWLNEKYKLDLDFPNLPYLIDGNFKLTQSKAILFYLGRKHNLMGKTLQEEGLVMMLCEQANDLRWEFSDLCYGRKGDFETEKLKFVETVLTNHLKQLDAYLGKKQGRFAVGDKPTVADFQLFDYIDAACSVDGGHELLNHYRNVKEFLQQIRELPEVKDYIAQSQVELPINGKMAKFGGTVIEQKLQ